MMDQIPARPHADSVLVVALVAVSPSDMKDFTSFFHPAATKNLIIIEAHKQDFVLKRPDRIERIYELSSVAHHQGWNFLIFIDSLTQSQLSGNVREGRSKNPSVIVSSVHTTSSSLSPSSSTTTTTTPVIAARRLDLRHLWMLSKRLTLPLLISLNKGYTLAQSYFDQGLLLYDPHRPVYSQRLPEQAPNVKNNNTNQIIRRIRDLPPELAAMILTEHCRLSNIYEQVSLPAYYHPYDPDIHIQLVTPLSDEKYNKLHHRFKRTFNHHASGNSFKLHRWSTYKPATRQEIWKLFERHFTLNRGPHRPFLFVEQHLLDRYKPISTVRWDYYKPPLVAPISIGRAWDLWNWRRGTRESAVEEWEIGNCDGLLDGASSAAAAATYNLSFPNPHAQYALKCHMAHHHGIKPSAGSVRCTEEQTGRVKDGDEDAIDLNQPYTELLLDYSGPFFHDPPEFIPGVDDGQITPVFLLTNNFGPEELSAMKEMLESHNKRQTPMIVDWGSKHDDEGGPEDMWRITWELYRYRKEKSPRCALFLDRRSVGDKEAVLTQLITNQPDDNISTAQYGSTAPSHRRPITGGHPKYGPFTGIYYVRVPLEFALCAWSSLLMQQPNSPDPIFQYAGGGTLKSGRGFAMEWVREDARIEGS